MEIDNAIMGGESKGTCDWEPHTPVKSDPERLTLADGKFDGIGGEGFPEPELATRELSFMIPENPIPNFILIDKSDDKNPHHEPTPKNKNQRKKRPKVKKHRPRVLDKMKTKTKNKPFTPKPKNLSTPKPRTPKRKLPDKTPIEPSKAPQPIQVYSRRKKLNFDTGNQTPTDQSQKVSVSIKEVSIKEVGAKLQDNVSNRFNSLMYSRRKKLNFDTENQTPTDQSQKVSVSIKEVGAKLQDNVSNRFNSLIVYRRVFRPNECLKNSRKLGPNFPRMFKKARMRRRRATTLKKYNIVDKLLNLGSIVTRRLTRSQARDLDFPKFATNLNCKGKRERSLMLVPKKKPRKKLLIMNLVLDSAMSRGEDEDAAYWAKERALFAGRLEEFVSKLNYYQGDKRYSEWKSSVVDSGVGVYLTQNVSDHLSSSAFMNLAARFPPVNCHRHFDEHEQFLSIEMDRTFNHSSQVGINLLNENRAESIPIQAESTPEIKEGNEEKNESQDTINWDELRTQFSSGKPKNKTCFTADSVNWEAVRQATVEELADVIKDRGMNNVLAAKIKRFLDRIVEEQGAIDLEWLRDVPPEKAKEFLHSFFGLGSKSVECVRLLALQHSAFPVDVNIARIATRLNWITLHDLPDGLLLHQLNEYPNIEQVQRFLAPRLKHISHAKLYEFHCHLILFGKSICTKDNPNCKVCPFQNRCKHYESKCKSEMPRLEGSTEGSSSNATSQETHGLCLLEGPPKQNMSSGSSDITQVGVDEPIIEFPKSPCCSESVNIQLDDIEDFCSNDEEDEMLTFDFSREDREASRALSCVVSTHPVLKSIEFHRLRTLHTVRELPDSHPLLAMFNKRDPNDPNPYLLKIWDYDIPDAAKELPNTRDIIPYHDEMMVKGTILIPCRTALGGSFPLNGTYFQNNEMFADHETSVRPIDIPREWVWNLRENLLYCSTSIRSICKEMTTPFEFSSFFRAQFMCIRGFDRGNGAPRPLSRKFHKKNKKKEDENYDEG